MADKGGKVLSMGTAKAALYIAIGFLAYNMFFKQFADKIIK